MTKAELIETLGRLGFTTDDGEDFGDLTGRHVRLRAPRVTEGETAAVLWTTPDSGVPQRRVVAYAEVETLLVTIDGSP